MMAFNISVDRCLFSGGVGSGTRCVAKLCPLPTNVILSLFFKAQNSIRREGAQFFLHSIVKWNHCSFEYSAGIRMHFLAFSAISCDCVENSDTDGFYTAVPIERTVQNRKTTSSLAIQTARAHALQLFGSIFKFADSLALAGVRF